MKRKRLSKILIGICLGLIIALVLPLASACGSAAETQTTTPTPIPTPSPTTEIVNGELMLSGTLKKNCTELNGSFSRDESPQVGDRAVDFRLNDIYGNEFVLSESLAVKPVVMVFGSIT